MGFLACGTLDDFVTCIATVVNSLVRVVSLEMPDLAEGLSEGSYCELKELPCFHCKRKITYGFAN